MTQIIAEAGSTHDGEKKKALELIEIARECGADAIKFQLLTQKELKGTGNVELNWDWFPDLIDWGNKHDIEVFASVFDVDGAKWLKHCKCKSIKFAYSRHILFNGLEKNAIDWGVNFSDFEKIYLSTDIMSGLRQNAVNLYCIPLYPIPYIIDFENIFPLFDGFSSHCLGIKQDVLAIDMGAKYVEKHFQGPWNSNTPDAKFAIRPEELRDLCKYAHDEEVRHMFIEEDD